MLGAGDVLAHYRIVSPLGKGGMGEVYAAEDTKLHRRVALKVLPPLVAADAAQRERFAREARAVAALNHPHIVTIHSVEEHEGRLFLTMELVEGQPLSEMIPPGGLPLDRILRIGAEIADAMSAAQAQGITHRDLKPANVMVAANGRAKVLDFGLAKLKDAEIAAAGGDLTRTSSGNDLTGEGRIVGTVAYMSPEQAEGKPVDPRSDIFSLGVMLHEMATGEKPFKGDTNVSVISAILKDTPPPVTDSKPGLPGDLARIVRRCLAKDPGRRYQTATDLRNELEDLRQGGASGAVVLPRPPAQRRMLGAAMAGVVVLAVIGAALVALKGRASPSRAADAPFVIDGLSRLTSTGTAFITAIAPDGRYVVHAKREAGGIGLWIRQTATASDVRIVAPGEMQFDGLAFSPDGNYIYYSGYPDGGGVASLFRIPVLGGTPVKVLEDVDTPIAFSPDGKQFAFMRGAIVRGSTEMMIAPAEGGPARVVASAPSPDRFQSDGIAWSPDGTAIIAPATSPRPGSPAVLYAVDARTGATTQVGPGWGFLRDVHWLPGGNAFLVTGLDLSGMSSPQIWRVTYPQGERARVTTDLSAYMGLSLSADARALATVQTETTSAVYVSRGPGTEPSKISGGSSRADGLAGMAWLPDGRLVYSSMATGVSQLWIARADGSDARQLTSTPGPASWPSSSPDGKWVYFGCYGKDGQSVCRVSADGSNLEQLTREGDLRSPIAAPDGTTVYVTSMQAPGPRLMRIPAAGGTPQLVSPRHFRAHAISFDGTRLLGAGWNDAARRTMVGVYTMASGAFEWQPDLPTGTLFLPDGGFATVRRIDGKATIVSLAKGHERRLLVAAGSETIWAGAVGRAGQIAYARGTQSSDVVLIKAK